jgi:hypothetical protein
LGEHPEISALFAAFAPDSTVPDVGIKRHVAVCLDCQRKVEALIDDTTVVMDAISALAPKFASSPSDNQPLPEYDVAAAEQQLLARVAVRPKIEFDELSVDLAGNRERARRSIVPVKRPSHVTSAYIAAACALLVLGASFVGYRFGRASTGGASSQMPLAAAPSAPTSAEKELQALRREHELLKTEFAEREKALSVLNQRIKDQQATIEQAREAEKGFESVAQQTEKSKQEWAAEKEALNANLLSAQAALTSLQNERQSAVQQVQQLSASLKARDRSVEELEHTVTQQQDLLAHDRDIRELMGARDLLVTEVYDLDQNGGIKRPYGRVFLTEKKSLVFYGFDLDKQPGVRNVSFQAWGNRGHDRKNAVNLGLLYEDSGTNKRWTLKLDNPETLAQIDAVFITLEPKSGSAKPTGKPILFASLKVAPNHP